MATAKLSLTGRALRLLSQREHSRAELERKLAPFEEEAGTLCAALDALQSKGFISEQRVVESLLHTRAPKLGNARLRHELQRKGLEPQLIVQTLDQLRNTEVARARQVWLKKFGQAAKDAGERGKQMRFLASRGFGADAIRRVVQGADDWLDEASDADSD